MNRNQGVQFAPELPVQFKPEWGVQFAPEYPACTQTLCKNVTVTNLVASGTDLQYLQMEVLS